MYSNGILLTHSLPQKMRTITLECRQTFPYWQITIANYVAPNFVTSCSSHLGRHGCQVFRDSYQDSGTSCPHHKCLMPRSDFPPVFIANTLRWNCSSQKHPESFVIVSIHWIELGKAKATSHINFHSMPIHKFNSRQCCMPCPKVGIEISWNRPGKFIRSEIENSNALEIPSECGLEGLFRNLISAVQSQNIAAHCWIRVDSVVDWLPVKHFHALCAHVIVW